MMSIAEAVVVLRVVDLKAKMFEARNDVAADFGIAFADRGGEDESVGTVKRGDELADCALDAVDEHFVSELCTFVAVIAEAHDFAHVVGLASDAFKAALFIEVLFELFAVELEVATDREGGRCVNIAAASRHHDAFERRVAHGGVEGFVVLESGDRATRTEVTDNDFFGGQVMLGEIVCD